MTMFQLVLLDFNWCGVLCLYGCPSIESISLIKTNSLPEIEIYKTRTLLKMLRSTFLCSQLVSQIRSSAGFTQLNFELRCLPSLLIDVIENKQSYRKCKTRTLLAMILATFSYFYFSYGLI